MKFASTKARFSPFPDQKYRHWDQKECSRLHDNSVKRHRLAPEQCIRMHHLFIPDNAVIESLKGKYRLAECFNDRIPRTYSPIQNSFPPKNRSSFLKLFAFSGHHKLHGDKAHDNWDKRCKPHSPVNRQDQYDQNNGRNDGARHIRQLVCQKRVGCSRSIINDFSHFAA